MLYVHGYYNWLRHGWNCMARSIRKKLKGNWFHASEKRGFLARGRMAIVFQNLPGTGWNGRDGVLHNSSDGSNSQMFMMESIQIDLAVPRVLNAIIFGFSRIGGHNTSYIYDSGNEFLWAEMYQECDKIHRLSVVHNDVTRENFLISRPQGSVWVIDG
jgi:hypothetical protein